MMSFADFLVGNLGPGVIIKFVERQDPVKLAENNADLIDMVLDSEFREKRSEKIQDSLVPFVQAYCKAFCARLLADQKGGRNDVANKTGK